MTSLIQNYEECEEIVRKLYDSKLRLGILDALSNGPLRLADLRRSVNANAPNTSSKAKELEEMGLIERAGSEYSISGWGKILHDNISRSLRLMAAKEKLSEYWKLHYMDGIHKKYYDEIGTYIYAKIVK